MNMLNRSIVARLGLLSLLSFQLLPVSAETFVREITRAFTAQPQQTLVVRLPNGKIDVSTHMAQQVQVETLLTVNSSSQETADKVFDSLKWTESESSEEILLIAKGRKAGFSLFNWNSRKLPEITMTIRCPENYNLDISVGSGDISTTAVTGILVFDTGSGNIRGELLKGDITADTGSGNISLTKVDGTFSGDTGSGNINLSQFSGAFSGDTGSGNINVSGSLTSFFADTGSGSVRIQSDTALIEDSLADTGSGNVTIMLPPEAPFLLEADSGSGSIQCTFPATNVFSSKDHYLKAQIHQGGPQLTIDTGSGNITVKQRDPGQL